MGRLTSGSIKTFLLCLDLLTFGTALVRTTTTTNLLLHPPPSTSTSTSTHTPTPPHHHTTTTTTQPPPATTTNRFHFRVACSVHPRKKLQRLAMAHRACSGVGSAGRGMLGQLWETVAMELAATLRHSRDARPTETYKAPHGYKRRQAQGRALAS